MRSVRFPKIMGAILRIGGLKVAENELLKLINRIFNQIKEEYGYTNEQTLIYLQGYQDCAKENQQSLERRDKMLRDTIAESELQDQYFSSFYLPLWGKFACNPYSAELTEEC